MTIATAAPATQPEPPGQPLRLLLAYALAWAGGCVAYTPFLTVLLPQRLTVLSGSGDVRWLGAIATVGALVASGSNLGWGWLSDRLGRRLVLSAIGLAAVALATAGLATSVDMFGLLVAVAVWQMALNLFLAPLAAYAADRIPDAQKGLLGGLLSFGPGLAALSVLAIAVVPPQLGTQLAVIVAISIVATMPLFVLHKLRPPRRVAVAATVAVTKSNRILVQLWFARLAIQIAEGLLFIFLYYALRTFSGGDLSLGRYAATNAAAQLAAIPVALAIGRYSDRTGRRRIPLLAMIGIIALGLAIMAGAGSWLQAVIGYAVFLIGSNSFLALHSTFAMQQLRNPRHHGRDLGIFNLTNTLPALITPLIAVTAIGSVGYGGLLFGLALAMAIPALLVALLDFA